jgi:hypothetical protein
MCQLASADTWLLTHEYLDVFNLLYMLLMTIPHKPSSWTKERRDTAIPTRLIRARRKGNHKNTVNTGMRFSEKCPEQYRIPPNSNLPF